MTQTASKPHKTIWNKVAFTGRLGKDPDMSFTPRGKAVTKFSLAVSQGKDKEAMWLDITCWEQLAEQVNSQAKRGSLVEVRGRLTQEFWNGKDGNKRRSFKVVAETVKVVAASKKQDDDDVDEGSDPLGDLEDHPF
jgi:single-strand DNA-binding protein